MYLSEAYKCAQHAVSSPNGSLIACLSGTTCLEVRKASDLQLIRTISLSPNFSGGAIRWSPSCDATSRTSRIAVFSEHGVHIENLLGQGNSAKINRGSGGMGRIMNACFGRTDDEFLVFTDFGSKVTVWSLADGRCVEIKDPKFSGSKGFAYRPSSGHFALLSRPGAQDILTLHAPNSYSVMWTANSPTMDAQGISWRPDGNFLAVWDSPSAGCKLVIYTACGDVFKTYMGESFDGLELGIKAIEWSTSGDILALSGYNNRVRILSTRTFSPIMYLEHVTPILLPEGSFVWQEEVSASSTRSFAQITRRVHPPTTLSGSSSSQSAHDTAVSIISFSKGGHNLASRYDCTPTTVWIWDVRNVVARAVIILHSPVKQLCWHPTITSLLCVQCQSDNVLHFFDTDTSTPTIVALPLDQTSGRVEVRWLPALSSETTNPAMLLSTSKSYRIIYPFGLKNVGISRIEEEQEDGDESMDSVYQVLTGRSPFKCGNTEILVSDLVDETCEIEDTFHGRRPLSTMV